MPDSSPPLRVTVQRILSPDPGIPDRKTGYPSAANPFAPDVTASIISATDDNRASIIFVQLSVLYISSVNSQHFKLKKRFFVDLTILRATAYGKNYRMCENGTAEETITRLHRERRGGKDIRPAL